MTFQEYQAKRKSLLNEAQVLINANKLNEFDSKEKEINDLDNSFEETKKKQANFNALNDKNGTLEYLNLMGIETNKTFDAFGDINLNSNAKHKATYIDEDGREIKCLQKGEQLSNFYKNTENLNLGKYIKGAITGDWKTASNEMKEFKALTTATSSVMIPTVLSSKVIDLARNKSLLLNSGVPYIDMESDNITISKLKTDPVFGFKEEGAEANESTMEFEGVELKSRTAYGLISITLEALKSSANLESVVVNAMAESMANAIDKACLSGLIANNEPKGVLTYDTINTIAYNSTSDYESFIKALSKIRQNNGDPTVWGMNAITDEMLNLVRDASGLYLDTPKALNALQRIISNQLPSDGGTGTDESTSLMYDPQAMLIGMQAPLELEISTQAIDAFKKGLVYIRVYSMLDIAVLRPKHLCKITGIK